MMYGKIPLGEMWALIDRNVRSATNIGNIELQHIPVTGMKVTARAHRLY
jgi:hypothetical protein